MKKRIFIILIIINLSFLFAQNVEVVKRIKFGTAGHFNYWTEWDPNEGSRSGLNMMAVKDNKMYLINEGDFLELNLSDDTITEKIHTEKTVYGGSLRNSWTDNLITYGVVGAGYPDADGVDFIILRNDTEYHIKTKNKDFSCIQNNHSAYCTENVVFFQTDTKEIICIELLDNGKYIFRNIEKTNEYLTDEKKDNLGFYFHKNSKNKTIRICIGDYSLNSSVDGINYWKIQNATFKMMSEKYSDKQNLNSFSDRFGFSVYKLVGYDSEGFQYFILRESENGIYSYDTPGFNVTFSIAVLDPWENKVYFYEDYKVNEWNPPRDKDGRELCSTSWQVAPDGNIYFTDCDVKNKEWLIKKITNRWYSDLNMDKRIIGTIIKNHIPLYTDSNASGATDGYNFENDIVWQKEEKGNWSKIQKLDGREGWVETKYITFNDDKSKNNLATITNVSVNKTMTCSDNLRLRSEEATTSRVITTMQKGTKVKILKLGKAETIDGITSNWVQVEVLAGAKDKDGKALKAGTIGWCYGGYLVSSNDNRYF
jgi:hypothetical protein